MLKNSESSIPFQGKMAKNSQSNYTIPIIAVIIGVIAICVTIVAFAFVFLPPSNPIPTVIQPTSSPSSLSNPYLSESIPLPTYTPGPTQTGTIVPTNTPSPTWTLIVIPTLESDSELLLLPDLTVTGISDPICVPDRIGTILEFTIFVRNIGRVSTRSFGPFDIGVFLILGQSRYGLDEWATQFNGVVGSSVAEVFNLNPDEDIKFTVVIDLKGNKNLGIEVIANSGENPIREADTNNNTLIKYFSAYCY